MNPTVWFSRPAFRVRAGADDEQSEAPAGRSLWELRRRIGSFGRGARHLPLVNSDSLEHTLHETRDWLQMMLDRHPYRVLGAVLALGAALGYAAARSGEAAADREG